MELLIGVGALFLWNQRDKNVIVSVWKQTDMFPRVVWFWFEATSYKPVTNCGCLKQKTECEKVWIRNKNKNAHPFGQWCFDHSVQTHTQDLNHNHYKGYPCALHFVHYYSVCLSLFNSKIVVFFFFLLVNTMGVNCWWFACGTTSTQCLQGDVNRLWTSESDCRPSCFERNLFI